MPTRTTSTAATVNGIALNNTFLPRCTYGWKLSVPESIVFVPRVALMPTTTWAATTAYAPLAAVKPTVRNGHVYQAVGAGTSGGSQPTWPTGTNATVTDGTVTWQEVGVDIIYDDVLVLTMGAGAHNVQRSGGLFRRFDLSLWPRAVGLVFSGYMIRALEYQNHDDPRHVGGLLPGDLAGLTDTPTDAEVIKAVLTLASVTYTGANIGGTGVTWCSRSPLNYLSYAWRAGTSPNVLLPIGQAGQSALDYIQSWDKVSAVYTAPTSPVGFYRTYETVNGVYRALIGGRPRSTPDLTFTEGVDIEASATSSREYPMANAAYVSGFDPGLGIGPVRNQDLDSNGYNTGAFLGQASNPFQPSGRSVTVDFGSPFIEWGTEAEGGIGMNCERVGNALLADLNREAVRIRFRTPRDDLILPGYTILVQGPGGLPDRLGIGENLWVDEVTTGVDEGGAFYQELVATGGGTPDTATPAPPG